MHKYDWLLVFHLFGAFLLLAGAVAIQVCALVAIRRTKPSDVAFFFNLGRIAEAAINAGAGVALLFGLWLTHYLGYGFGQGWIVAAIVLFVAAAGLGGAGGARYKKTRLEAERLAGAGDQPTPELEQLKRDPLAFWLTTVSGIAAIAILIDMVWKPGAHF